MISLVSLLLAFTSPTAPARHPSFMSPLTATGQPAVFIHDPNQSAAGVPNVVARTSSCSSTQAIGLYDDGGVTDIVCVDSATQTNVNGQPATPAADSATLFEYAVDAGFPSITATVDGANGLLTPTGVFSQFWHYGTAANWDVQCGWPLIWGNTGINYFNVNTNSVAFQSTGTQAAVAWSSASFLGRQKQITFVTAAANNAAAEIKAVGAHQQVWRGDSAGAGGFLVWIRAGMSDTTAHARAAFGLFNTTGILTTNVDPNTLANSVYFGCNDGDANLSVCSNDNSGNATCNTLGASFPCQTDGAYYDFWLFAGPNSSTISYAITRLDSAASAGGLITSDLPQNSVQLNWHANLNSGATGATAVKIGWLGACVAGNY